MIEIKDIEKLAALARVEIPEAEKEALTKEFDSILAYVGQIKEAGVEVGTGEPPKESIFNAMRDDANPHESGLFTLDLVNEAPQKEGDYIKVKKIL